MRGRKDSTKKKKKISSLPCFFNPFITPYNDIKIKRPTSENPPTDKNMKTGPRMNWNDGRVVSNFILQALRGENITIYGDGSATRSFQYIHDLVDGLIMLMNSSCTEPVNLGNPEEFTIKQFADVIVDLVADYKERLGESGSSVGGNSEKDTKTKEKKSEVVFLDAVVDDPQRRKPDTTKAKEVLGWSPHWTVVEGLRETVAYFHKTLYDEHGVIQPGMEQKVEAQTTTTE